MPSGLCAGHDPEAQERARSALQEKGQGLGLPLLKGPADAEAWIAQVGQLLAIEGSLSRGFQNTIEPYLQTTIQGFSIACRNGFTW